MDSRLRAQTLDHQAIRRPLLTHHPPGGLFPLSAATVLPGPIRPLITGQDGYPLLLGFSLPELRIKHGRVKTKTLSWLPSHGG